MTETIVNHPVVGTGYDFWTRPINRYAGCTCPLSRYNPSQIRPVDPGCAKHGEPVGSEHHQIEAKEIA